MLINSPLLSYANQENGYSTHSFLNKLAGGETRFGFLLFVRAEVPFLTYNAFHGPSPLVCGQTTSKLTVKALKWVT